MKARKIAYTLAAILLLAAAVVSAAMIIDAAGTALPTGIAEAAASIAGGAFSLVPVIAWSFPLLLAVMAVLLILSASYRFLWPSLLFTGIIGSTLILLLHVAVGSDYFPFLVAFRQVSGSRAAGIYLFSGTVAEVLVFLLWARIAFSNAKAVMQTTGGTERQSQVATGSEKPGDSLPDITRREKRRIERSVKQQMNKRHEKLTKKARRQQEAEEIARERRRIAETQALRKQVSDTEHPAYRSAEGEHQYGLADQESIFDVHDVETAGTAVEQVKAPMIQDPDDLTLRFPEIPDLPELSVLGSGKKDLQQEMSFDDQSPGAAVTDAQLSAKAPREGASAERTASRESQSLAERARAVGRDRHAVIAEAIQRSRGEQNSHDDTEGPGQKEPPVHSGGTGSLSDDPPTDESPFPEVSGEVEDEYVPGIIGLVSHNEEPVEGQQELFRTIRKGNYIPPPESLLIDYPDISSTIDKGTRRSGEILMQTLKEFKIEASLTGVQKGPVVTMFEILPAPGIRVQTITNLADNIALQLAASRVRIVAPIPGKQAVGIEVPNSTRSIVGFKEMLYTLDRHPDYAVPMVLGTDITGERQIIDLVRTPHLLIAGATGSGKSVCVNSLICSILYRRSPREVRMIMVDPKIVELKLYNNIPHLLTPVITEAKKALKALQYCLFEMERRYSLLDALNVRDLASYNRRIDTYKLAREKLPYIVVIIDEFADLMTTTGKEMEGYLARLAAMARAVGIHLVLATQRPSTNVITGIIKANIPSRIAFMVTSNTDSRIIIDQPGAEKLLGRGDMLFSSSWDPIPSRIQGAFLSEEEVEKVVGYVKEQGEPDYLDEAYFMDDDEGDGSDDDYGGEDDDEDSLMQEALKIVAQRGTASASYLQRRLKIGYNRAARLVEEMEDRGIVGPAQGSKPREVLRMPGMDGT